MTQMTQTVFGSPRPTSARSFRQNNATSDVVVGVGLIVNNDLAWGAKRLRLRRAPIQVLHFQQAVAVAAPAPTPPKER